MKKLSILLASVLFCSTTFCVKTNQVKKSINSLFIEKIQEDPDLEKLFNIALSHNEKDKKSCIDTIWKNITTGELSPETLQKLVISAKIISHMKEKVALEEMLNRNLSIIPFEIYALIDRPLLDSEIRFMDEYVNSLNTEEQESFKTFVEDDFKMHEIHSAIMMQNTAFEHALRIFEGFNHRKSPRKLHTALQRIIDSIRNTKEKSPFQIERLLPTFALSNWEVCNLVLKNYTNLYYRTKILPMAHLTAKKRTSEGIILEILKSIRSGILIPDPVVPDIYFLDECETSLNNLKVDFEKRCNELKCNNITIFHIIYLRKAKKIFNILYPLEVNKPFSKSRFLNFFNDFIKQDRASRSPSSNLVQSILQLTNAKIATKLVIEFAQSLIKNINSTSSDDIVCYYSKQLSNIADLVTNGSPSIESVKSLSGQIPQLPISILLDELDEMATSDFIMRLRKISDDFEIPLLSEEESTDSDLAKQFSKKSMGEQ